MDEREPAASEFSSEQGLDLPRELPPVEPPSAGMIIQLFLVPAVIVAVVVAVYLLFGQLATAELDWRQLVTDVNSENPNIRWRGALGLAHMLDADLRRGEASQDLNSNPDIAIALAELYQNRISIKNPREEEIKQIEFLSKALGRMDVEDVIAPAFLKGVEDERDHEIRKQSMLGLAMLAGQLHQQQSSLESAAAIDRIIEISNEAEPLFRQQAAYTLGLIHDPRAENRLQMLLDDPDQMTRINAAIGFARNDSVAGLPVFAELLQAAPAWNLDPSEVQTQDDESLYFERKQMLLNALKAITQLRPELTDAQRSEFKSRLEALTESTSDANVLTEAKQLIHLL